MSLATSYFAGASSVQTLRRDSVFLALERKSAQRPYWSMNISLGEDVASRVGFLLGCYLLPSYDPQTGILKLSQAPHGRIVKLTNSYGKMVLGLHFSCPDMPIEPIAWVSAEHREAGAALHIECPEWAATVFRQRSRISRGKPIGWRKEREKQMLRVQETEDEGEARVMIAAGDTNARIMDWFGKDRAWCDELRLRMAAELKQEGTLP